jgi:hypothetical protein
MMTSEPNTRAATMLRALSANDWARFGLSQVAYLRPALLNGVHVVEIRAADGQQIGAAPNLAAAAAAVVQHEMAPVLLH